MRISLRQKELGVEATLPPPSGDISPFPVPSFLFPCAERKVRYLFSFGGSVVLPFLLRQQPGQVLAASFPFP